MSFLFSLVWGSWIGRITAAVLLGMVALKGYGYQQQYVGARDAAKHIVETSKKIGSENNAKADAARKQLDIDKYFDRMFKKYCRDC